MSAASEVERISLLTTGLRNKMIAAGQAAAGDTLATLVQNLSIITSSGISPVHTTDASAWSANWLSHTAPTTNGGVTTYGEPLSPAKDNIYMIVSSGEYLRRLVTWDGSAYKMIGKINVVNGIETDLYVPNTASEDGKSGLVPPAPAGTQDYVFTEHGWDETPLYITEAEIDEIFGRSLPTALYYDEEVAVGTYNGNTLYSKTITGLNVSVGASGTTIIAALDGATRIIESLFHTATGAYYPLSVSLSGGNIVVESNGASATIVSCSVKYLK